MASQLLWLQGHVLSCSAAALVVFLHWNFTWWRLSDSLGWHHLLLLLLTDSVSSSKIFIHSPHMDTFFLIEGYLFYSIALSCHPTR